MKCPEEKAYETSEFDRSILPEQNNDSVLTELSNEDISAQFEPPTILKIAPGAHDAEEAFQLLEASRTRFRVQLSDIEGSPLSISLDGVFNFEGIDGVNDFIELNEVMRETVQESIATITNPPPPDHFTQELWNNLREYQLFEAREQLDKILYSEEKNLDTPTSF